MHLVAAWVRLTAKPNMATAARARAAMQQPKKSVPPPDKLLARHDVQVRKVDGFECWTVAPRDKAARAAVYLHGGAYIRGTSRQHWALIGAMADAGVQVEVPLYGLAPEHTFEAAYALATSAYTSVLSRFEPESISIVGDSAGGGLALGLAQTFLAAGVPQPGRIALIAPWLDLALTNPDTARFERRDPWLSSAGLREAGRAWAGGHDHADPRLSPVNGPMAGLAPVSVWIGTRDLFYPDAVLLRRRADTAGVTGEWNVGEGAIHVYPLLPTPEGRRASKQLVAAVSG